MEDLEEVEGEEVKWGVMTVISFIPLFNWLVRRLVAAPMQLYNVKDTTVQPCEPAGPCLNLLSWLLQCGMCKCC